MATGPTISLTTGNKAARPSAIRGEASAEQVLSSLASLATARELLREDCDPLEIKDTGFIRQVQMQLQRQILPQEPSSISLQESATQASASLSQNTLIATAAITTTTSIIISQPNFDARLFLRQVHGETRFEELMEGRASLRRACQTRDESLKNLVKQNFDRFVNAKNSIELVYRDMQQRRLIEADHGMRKAIEALSNAYQCAHEVYSSLLGRREREHRIRARLELFSKHSLTFGLGYRLEQARRLGEYSTAVYDYKRAKAVLQTVESQTLRALLKRIWAGHIEKAVSMLRQDLIAKLVSPVFSYDVHAKLINLLIDLDAHPDPVVNYFETSRKELEGQVRAALERTMEEMAQVTADPETQAVPKIILGLLQKHTHSLISTLEVDIVRVWKIRSSFLFTTAALYARFISGYGRFLGEMVGGDFCRDLTRRPVEMTAAIERVQLFSDAFGTLLKRSIESLLSDQPLLQRDIQENSIVAALYANKMAIELGRILLATAESKAPSAVRRTLQGVYETLIVAIIKKIWEVAKTDCALLPCFEDWQWTGDGYEYSTAIIKSFELLLIFLINSTASIIRGIGSVISNPAQMQANPIAHLDRLLSQAVCAFLSGLQGLLLTPPPSKEQQSIQPDRILAAIDALRARKTLLSLGEGYRLLTVLCNIVYLRQVAIPHLISVFSSLPLGGFGDIAKQSLSQTIDGAETQVRSRYLQGKQGRLTTLVRNGLLGGSFDWSTEKTPTAVRPYLNAILLELVAVQIEICDVSIAMMRPLIAELVVDIFQTFLHCIQLIRNFGPGGYLQARLEVDLLQHKLISVMDQEAVDLVSAIHSSLLSTTSNPPPPTDAKRLIDQLISKVEESTSLIYSCFQHS